MSYNGIKEKSRLVWRLIIFYLIKNGSYFKTDKYFHYTWLTDDKINNRTSGLMRENVNVWFVKESCKVEI